MNAPARLDPLSELRATGLTVTLDAERLIVTPASALTDANRRSLRENRVRIVAELNAEADELARLIHRCGEAYGFTEQEHMESIVVALAKPAEALTCFRAMVRDL